MISAPDFQLTDEEDARRAPLRVALVQEDERPAVDLHDEEMVMTVPHLLVREMIALIAASLLLVIAALAFNAPLEELADPQRTPNPAKAPWYFLGLQELLHYYPPLISGVILPGAVIAALAIVPYFEVNLRREPLWKTGVRRKLALLGTVVALVVIFFIFSAPHPVWPVIGTTIACGVAMSLPAVMGDESRAMDWLSRRSLAFWIFSWFLLSAVVMTIIGVYFRGPGWEFTLPWRDGVY